MDFCAKHKHCQTSSNINFLLEFFNYLFQEGQSYSSLLTAKAALINIVTVPNIAQWELDNNIIRFFKGAYKLRPPKPKYCYTWDVNLVLGHIKKSLNDNSCLSLKNLTIKCIFLTALISGQRAQSIHKMDLSLMHKSDNCIEFFFNERLKTDKSSRTSIEINKYKDGELCVYSCLCKYMEITQSLRKTTKLWISFNKPYKSISIQSVSRWIKIMLKAANIDTAKFSGHSTRHASTSKVAHKGTDINHILQTAGWASECSFTKFYYKPVATSGKKIFADTVLDQDP